MSDFDNPLNLNALSALLTESSDAAKEHSNNNQAYNQLPQATGPTSVRIRDDASIAEAEAERLRKEKEKEKRRDDIWGDTDIPSEDAIISVQTKDNRPEPRYEFSYKQAVGTEDTFLGLSNKTPGSSDCTHLIIKIHFPNATLKELDVDVIRNRIKAESKTHFLFTYLPVEVDGDKGEAKFDPKKRVLSITVPIIHEF